MVCFHIDVRLLGVYWFCYDQHIFSFLKPWLRLHRTWNRLNQLLKIYLFYLPRTSRTRKTSREEIDGISSDGIWTLSLLAKFPSQHHEIHSIYRVYFIFVNNFLHGQQLQQKKNIFDFNRTRISWMHCSSTQSINYTSLPWIIFFGI